mgnify:CR=1 FL=1
MAKRQLTPRQLTMLDLAARPQGCSNLDLQIADGCSAGAAHSAMHSSVQRGRVVTLRNGRTLTLDEVRRPEWQSRFALPEDPLRGREADRVLWWFAVAHAAIALGCLAWLAFDAAPHQMRSLSPGECGSSRRRPGGFGNIGRGFGLAKPLPSRRRRKVNACSRAMS